jgi:hypothetical protein
MLEVEARLGTTLEEDFHTYYIEKGWGQKKLSKRWGVSRATIFGQGQFIGRRAWVQLLNLPTRQGTPDSDAPLKPLPACEVCGLSGVPLEGAHWIPGAEGGDRTSDNIIKLCPNCHTKLDLSEDATVIAHARAVLLARVARRFVEGKSRSRRDAQLEFVEICRSIIEARNDRV